VIRAPRIPAAFFDWLTVARSLTIVAVAVGLEAALAIRSPQTAAQVAPLIGFVVAAPLIALAGHYLGWIDERIWAPWQGIYHAFDDHQVRVVEARDRLWFASEDVHAVLRMPCREAVLLAMRTSECRRDEELGLVLSTAGLVRLLGRSTDRQALRLLTWARHDVERPWAKKRALAGLAAPVAATNDASPKPASPSPAASVSPSSAPTTSSAASVYTAAAPRDAAGRMF
jgi:hypothetical protein